MPTTPTTIKSSALDFNAIKNNLKEYFQAQDEFRDYDFEGSGLSNILDVLAYNTHLNALTANFAVNESFLGTAQLRGSVVSLSEAIGYIPSSKAASRAVVEITLNLTNYSNLPGTITLPPGQMFQAAVDGISYVFHTLDTLIAQDPDNTGIYQFTSSRDGSTNITIYEGSIRTKTFYVGGNDDNTVYVIPDVNMDIETASVKVYDSVADSNGAYDVYTDFKHAVTIDDNTKYYLLRESPNENFDLTFGNGSSLGLRPRAGNKVEVTYLSTVGSFANGASIFTPSSAVTITDTRNNVIDDFRVLVKTKNKSHAGSDKESVESIRYNAPYVYASQNRMVTARDYAAVILERFPNLIRDIVAWGGEDNINPTYGVTFVSVIFEDGVAEEDQVIAKAGIQETSEHLSVMSFDLEFTDPVETFIETGVTFDFNPELSALTLNAVQSNVRLAVSEYLGDVLGDFGESFRKSNMLTVVDDVSVAVLSSNASVKMQQRIVPIFGNESFPVLNNFTIDFPAAIATPDDKFYRIESSLFTFKNQICSIKNKLNSTTLQVVSSSDGSVVADAIGSYNPTTGVVKIVGFKCSKISGGLEYIKVSVIPANVNTITPVNNNVLAYDPDNSFVQGTVA